MEALDTALDTAEPPLKTVMMPETSGETAHMARQLPTGNQKFEDIRRNRMFYVDKTAFIAKWWASHIGVTVVNRPRGFGKTLMLGAIERLFSPAFQDQEELFEGLNVWKNEEVRKLAGQIPTILLTFGDAGQRSFKDARQAFASKLAAVVGGFAYLQASSKVPPRLRQRLNDFNADSDNVELFEILRSLSEALFLHHGLKPVILVDDYDTLLFSAWSGNYRDEMSDLLRGWENATFKTNESLDRALLTGVTDGICGINNAMTVAVSTPEYQTDFGFTEDEVQDALNEYGIESGADAKKWYGGFAFGNVSGIFNPRSIVRYLQFRVPKCYWTDNGEDDVVEHEIKRSGKSVKASLVTLLNGGRIESKLSDNASLSNQQGGAVPIWSLLAAGGCVKAVSRREDGSCELELTNHEVKIGFETMIYRWFDAQDTTLDDFIRALLNGDTDAMTDCLQAISAAGSDFSDGKPNEPENFYLSFVLGLMIRLKDRYLFSCNRESGPGRYDVLLVPENSTDYAFILEFKA